MSSLDLSPTEKNIESGKTNVVKVEIVGGAKQAATVLRALHERHRPARNYSLVPGDGDGTKYLTIMEPIGDDSLFETGTRTDPEILLAKHNVVLSVHDAQEIARRHFRAIIDPSHRDAEFFEHVMQELGGHIQGRRKKMKLTADRDALNHILSFAKGAPGLVRLAKVGVPYLTALRDEPKPSHADTTASPEFAPAAVRHTVKVECHPDLGHDSEILERLERDGFDVSSVGSRVFHTSTDGEIQEMMILMHGGSKEALRRSLADINALIGVRHVDVIGNAESAQYIQMVVAPERNSAVPEILAHYRKLQRDRVRLTYTNQHLIADTLPLQETISLRRDLTASGIGNRVNPVIVPNDGGPLRTVESRWPNDDSEDAAFSNYVTELQRRDLLAFIAKRNRDAASRDAS